MKNTTWGRAACVAGPACLTAYGLIRLTDQEHGPGSAWTLGHLAMLTGVLAFIPVFLTLHRAAARGTGPAGRAVAGAGALLGLYGTAAVTVQSAIDLDVGFRAADRAGMDELFQEVQSDALVKAEVYSVGPLLFYIGLVLLTAQLAVQRRAAAWRPVAVVAGIAAAGASLDLMPVAGLLFLAALGALGRAGGADAAGGLTDGLCRCG
ncbi:hypothetical protein ACFP1Z_16595 [Streptomyces gamaensis]|uniref:DUF4386 domain-containing protein n=1 Tax=Streptomyces gamaensis TaxID=1763542 RepID=A0ABW0Z1X3_9ACTN